MKFKTIKTIEYIVCVIMPIILAISVIFEIWYLPLVALLAAAVLFGVLMSRTKEVYEDELTRAIEEKGGHAANTIGTILMVLAGSILLGISKDNTSAMGIAAITLFATSFGLGTIEVFTKLYYKAKLGPKNE